MNAAWVSVDFFLAIGGFVGIGKMTWGFVDEFADRSEAL